MRPNQRLLLNGSSRVASVTFAGAGTKEIESKSVSEFHGGFHHSPNRLLIIPRHLCVLSNNEVASNTRPSFASS